MRGHPTKYQLKENLPHTRIILSNTWPALLLCTFRKIQSFRRFQCRFFVSVRSPVNCAPGALCTAPPPCLECCTRTWLVPGVGGGEHRRSWRLLRWQHHPWRPTEYIASSQHRSAPPNAPLPSAWPHACQHTPLHRRRGLARTGRALCRRRVAQRSVGDRP